MGEESKIKKDLNEVGNRFYKKMPRWVQFCLFGIIAVGGFCWWFFGVSPAKAINLAYARIVSNVQEPKSVENTPAVLGSKKIKCYFNDDKKWIGRNEFFISGEVFFPNITENFSEGREMFCDEKIGNNFVADFKFIPLNEKEINVSINYGYAWRIIIGNGDYNQIQAQINSKYAQQDLHGSDWVIQGQDWKKRNGVGYKSGNQLKVKIISSISKEDSRKVNLTLILGGMPDNPIDDSEKTFNFVVITQKDASEFSENLGVGIIVSRKKYLNIKKNIEVKFEGALEIQPLEI